LVVSVTTIGVKCTRYGSEISKPTHHYGQYLLKITSQGCTVMTITTIITIKLFYSLVEWYSDFVSGDIKELNNKCITIEKISRAMHWNDILH